MNISHILRISAKEDVFSISPIRDIGRSKGSWSGQAQDSLGQGPRFCRRKNPFPKPYRINPRRHPSLFWLIGPRGLKASWLCVEVLSPSKNLTFIDKHASDPHPYLSLSKTKDSDRLPEGVISCFNRQVFLVLFFYLYPYMNPRRYIHPVFSQEKTFEKENGIDLF